VPAALGNLPHKGDARGHSRPYQAADAESAVKEWIEKFDITDPQQQERLVARPVK
jgi:hypothetical protein